MRRLLIVCFVLAALVAPAAPAIAAPPQGDNKWALIIGVDIHSGRTRNNVGAVGDAMAFRELLARDGWRDDRVRVLTNGEANAANIRAGMQWLVDNCDDTSYCIFHFSGHTKQANGGDSTGGLHEYLWPSDNRFISDDEFSDYMRRLRGYAWVDLANCESAGFDHGISSARRLFTGASQETEKGFENPEWARSIWTGNLVQKAMLDRIADANGDGHVTLKEALPYAADVSARMTAGQTPSPQHPYIRGGEEADWFPAPVAAPPAVAPKACILIFICL